jgi:Peptidase A4 family
MATSETYTNVYGYWLEPSIAQADCPSPQTEVTWAGLGGQPGSSYIAQAGTGYGFDGMSSHEAWYEFYPADPVPVPSITATVGGEMYVNIYRASSKGFDIFIENEYTGAYWPSGSDFKSESEYDGAVAEFIVEDPGGVPSGDYLIRFGTFEVQDAEASVNDSTFEGLASWPHDDVEMYADGEGGGDELAHAGAAFNNGDSWYDYHDNCA